MEAPSLLIALLAGLFSFLSPCVLPLIPAYIGYMSGSALTVARNTPSGGGRASTGTAATAAIAATGQLPPSRTAKAIAPNRLKPGSTTEAKDIKVVQGESTMSSAVARWVVMGHAAMFVIGLTIVFVVVIGGMAGALSYLLKGNIRIIQQIMGVLLVVFGLHMIGLINIPFLNYTRRMDIRPATNLGYLRSLLIGMGFGIGWTPCVGPTLGAILTLSINGRTDQAFMPALAYSLGLSIPFLLTALAMGQVSAVLKRITRKSYTVKVGNWTLIDQANIISLGSGLLLIMMGVLVWTNSLTILTRLAPGFGI